MTTLERSVDDIKLLQKGSHSSADQGLCAMEAVAWLAGEPHSDKPDCVCPVIAAYARRINDASWGSDAERTEALRPYLARLIGTRSTEEIEHKRGFLCADYAVRTILPGALDRRGAAEVAQRLREMVEITDRPTALAGRAAATALDAYAYAYAYAAYAAACAAYAADDACASYAETAAYAATVCASYAETAACAATVCASYAYAATVCASYADDASYDNYAAAAEAAAFRTQMLREHLSLLDRLIEVQ